MLEFPHGIHYHHLLTTSHFHRTTAEATVSITTLDYTLKEAQNHGECIQEWDNHMECRLIVEGKDDIMVVSVTKTSKKVTPLPRIAYTQPTTRA
jgi:hypothetical protein